MCNALPLVSLSVNKIIFLAINLQFSRALYLASFASPLNSLGAPLGKVVALVSPHSAKDKTSISPSVNMTVSCLHTLS